MKVLLVEDHPAVAKISCDLLRDLHGHDVAHAANGQSALEMAGTFQPNLVLIDINLPDINGYDLAANLRSQVQFSETILVALTGFGIGLDQDRAHAAGFDAHFRKPMEFEALNRVSRRSDATPAP